MNTKTWIAVLLLAATTGCPTAGALFVPEPEIPDKALIYIYRAERFAGAAVAFEIYANNQHIADLPNRGYYPYFADPGRVALSTKRSMNYWITGVAPEFENPREGVFVDAEAGETYFVEAVPQFGYIALFLRPYAGAMPVLKKCGLGEANPSDGREKPKRPRRRGGPK